MATASRTSWRSIPISARRQDLRDLVRTAHRNGIYVILDIILNHTGNVFGYTCGPLLDAGPGKRAWYLDPRWDGGPYEVKGFHDATGEPAYPLARSICSQYPQAWPDGAIWPVEFQDPGRPSRPAGRSTTGITTRNFVEGDFFDLKDVDLGEWNSLDDYQPLVGVDSAVPGL